MKAINPTAKRFADLPAPGWMAVCRGSALGLCVLLGMNVAEVFVHSTNAADNWFCKLHPIPGQFAMGILALTATCLFLFSMRPALPGPVWFCAGLMVLTMVGGCGRDIWVIQDTIVGDDRITAIMKPLGVTMLFLVAGIGVLTGTSSSVQGRSSVIAILFSAVLSVIGFAVVTVQSGGISDVLPDKVIDVVLVPGLPTTADGAVSEELDDRIRTAARLIRDRHARSLVITVGSDATAESQSAIRAAASDEGVDEQRITLKAQPQDVAATVEMFAADFRADKKPESIADALIVSHWFELARCRLLAKRAGLSPTVIAAEQKHAVFNQNVRVGREVMELLKQLAQPTVQLVRGTASANTTTVDEHGGSSSGNGEMDLDDQLEDLKSMEL